MARYLEVADLVDRPAHRLDTRYPAIHAFGGPPTVTCRPDAASIGVRTLYRYGWSRLTGFGIV